MKQVVKTNLRGGARPRKAIDSVKRSKSGQKFAIHKVIEHFGGLTPLARQTSEILKEKKFPLQNWSNWRLRGLVPVQLAFKIGRGLRVDPRLLNYIEASDMLEDKRSWEQVVNGVEFFDKKTKKEILAYRGPK